MAQDVAAGSVALTVRGRPLASYAARQTEAERFSQADLDLIGRGKSENTKRTLRATWKRIIQWTGDNGCDEIPWSEVTCVKWIDANWSMPGLYGRPASPRTVRLSLWAITRAHRMAMRPDGTRGYETPVTSPLVQDAMAGYIQKYKRAGHRPVKASPITKEELVALVETCDVRSPVGLLPAFAFSLGYDMGARVSELVAARFEHVELRIAGDVAGAGRVDPSRPAEIELADTDYMIVHVPYSKTDQEGDGDEVYIYAHPPAAAATCPIRLHLAHCELRRQAGRPLTGPLLTIVAYGGRPPADGRPRKGTLTDLPVTEDGLERMMRRAAQAAGLQNPEGVVRHFSWHGFRAGSAEEAAEGGADTPELNRHFRWSQRGVTAQQYANRGLKRRHNPAKRIWRDFGRKAPARGNTAS